MGERKGFRGMGRMVEGCALPMSRLELRWALKDVADFAGAASVSTPRPSNAGRAKRENNRRCARAHHEESGGSAGQRYTGRMEVRIRTPTPHFGQPTDGGVASTARSRRH
jgi:hypothetical protein